ncbi:Uncharacterized protein FWK35_00005430 [Aphis craccivora]|uniref:Uncharacterized protein n=1 Tax=Aphis craccivora TaxID=307492 RepID=A0A6G0ZD82_APHCR|nr:Uncharacterized protein FWK35_00005430 [Aphis craccivora]
MHMLARTLLEQLRRDDRKWRAAGGIRDGAGGTYGAGCPNERRRRSAAATNRHRRHRLRYSRERPTRRAPPFTPPMLRVSGSRVWKGHRQRSSFYYRTGPVAAAGEQATTGATHTCAMCVPRLL